MPVKGFASLTLKEDLIKKLEKVAEKHKHSTIQEDLEFYANGCEEA